MPVKVSWQATADFDWRLFEPVLKAYSLGWASTTIPRLFGLLGLLRRKDLSVQDKIDLLYRILKTSVSINRFPTSCAVIVGGATLLPRLIKAVLVALCRVANYNVTILRSRSSARRLQFISTFFSALLAFDLLNIDEKWKRARANSRDIKRASLFKYDLRTQQDFRPEIPPNFAGKTIDFTCFAASRAADVLFLTLWTRTRALRLHPEHITPRLAKAGAKLADPLVFVLSASTIMWSWFYAPHRLPRAYTRWISSAAAIDTRIIEALRRMRSGEWTYGKPGEHNHLLVDVCKDCGITPIFGDPQYTIPVDCSIVHQGLTPNCELHAVHRFHSAFSFAFKMYLPLQLLIRIRGPHTMQSLLNTVKSAAQSSSFLALFISSFFYAVCFTRSRLAPLLRHFDLLTNYCSPQAIDAGLCVLAGCIACGWSVLLEKPSRRQEIAFFVAPRALATLLPRVYSKEKRWREGFMFASCVAVVVDAAQVQTRRGGQKRVRGMLGGVLESVLK